MMGTAEDFGVLEWDR